ncbi:excitatory amino acid transporter 1-like [Haliotis rufescens]|uniref:excitatory amino acid transporter 1-like n=1 Tax=Haliotis rufescens TaxID=6454 RepID=UPI00201F5A8D|nr:excitatory amino acid transporter 1-like [Haliotis rufescens]
MAMFLLRMRISFLHARITAHDRRARRTYLLMHIHNIKVKVHQIAVRYQLWIYTARGNRFYTTVTMETDTPPIKRRKTRKQMLRSVLMDNLLVILLILAVAIGIGMGFALRLVWSPDDKRKIFYLAFPGQLLLNMLKCLILPLVVSSLITGLAALDKSVTGKLGGAAVLYYLTTTLLAVVLGIILVLSIQPGFKGGNTIERTGKAKLSQPIESLLDLIRNCFPNNIVTACFERGETVISLVEKKLPAITTVAPGNMTTMGTMTTTVTSTMAPDPIFIETPSIKMGGGTNVLGVVVFSIALGCVINYLGPMGVPLKNFFESLNAATMILVKLVIWYSPFGIMFLIATKFIEMEDPTRVFEQLLYYFLTVLAGLAIHGLIFLPLIYFIATRKNPYLFIFRQMKAIITAWGTASSSATLPITMECLVNRNKIHRNIVRFVAPVGATINMDGTALYEAVAAIFIAQYNGRILTIAEVIIISLTATAAAIGAAGVPQAGLVTMVIVLTAVNLPTNDVTLILAIDWFLDRFRTAINVLGDSFGAGILGHIFRHTFANIPDVDGDLQAYTDMESDSSDKPANGDVKGTDITKIYPNIEKQGLDNAAFQMNTRM